MPNHTTLLQMVNYHILHVYIGALHYFFLSLTNGCYWKVLFMFPISCLMNKLNDQIQMFSTFKVHQEEKRTGHFGHFFGTAGNLIISMLIFCCKANSTLTVTRMGRLLLKPSYEFFSSQPAFKSLWWKRYHLLS